MLLEFLLTRLPLRMASNVMSLQSKLTLQKNKTIVKLVVIFAAVFAIGTVLAFSINSCGFDHVGITNDLKFYEQTLDPEFCEDLVEKIDMFNEQCSPYIETLDCG